MAIKSFGNFTFKKGFPFFWRGISRGPDFARVLCHDDIMAEREISQGDLWIRIRIGHSAGRKRERQPESH